MLTKNNNASWGKNEYFSIKLHLLQVLNPQYDATANSMDDSDDESESGEDEDDEDNSENESKMNGNGINGHCLDNEDDEESDGSEIDEQSSDDDNDNTEQLKLALHKAMMSANQHSDDVIIKN